VSIHTTTAPVEVNHVSGYRVFNVRANTDGRDIGRVARDLGKKLAQSRSRSACASSSRQYLGFKNRFEPRSACSWRQSSSMLLVACSLLLGPLIIMFTSARPDRRAGHALPDARRSTCSHDGRHFLVGIVVSNGVSLVDFANKQREAGLSVRRYRFCPRRALPPDSNDVLRRSWISSHGDRMGKPRGHVPLRAPCRWPAASTVSLCFRANPVLPADEGQPSTQTTSTRPGGGKLERVRRADGSGRLPVRSGEWFARVTRHGRYPAKILVP